ncbi:MAG TPA: hypothetical protein VFY05_10360, partial [Candidatus Angelobacter sp.]|nr:hypothetical protein [Candidatus Angelobacter sp.]
ERMKNKMNCQQFQEVLPYIIESGGNQKEEEHLRSCPACAELVQDLRYIADQAKLLLPMHDPNPRVWNNIEQSLQQEGLLPEGRMSRPGHTLTYPTPTQSKSWTPFGWLMALAAITVLAAVLVNYKPHLPGTQLAAQNSSVQSTQLASDDQQVVSQMSRQDPTVGQAYEQSLKETNAYISDAEQAVRLDPEDAVAQQQLVEAHAQKAMLYQMATARTLP